MRSLAVLAAAAAAFAAVVILPHVKAQRLLDAEAQALDELKRAVAAGHGAPVRETGGYRFRWVLDGPLPPLLVAEPVEPGRTGARSFATMAGRGVYERDPVMADALPGRITEADLRYYLSLPPSERKEEEKPNAWLLLEPPPKAP